MNWNRFCRRVCRIVLLACGTGLLASGAGLQAAAATDIIELKTGQKLEGDVLKDVGGELGVDIVRIPASQIKSRHAKDAASKAEGETRSEQHEMYKTADLPIRTIKELSQKFGEGVVLVKTSSGLGSGFILDERGHCVTN